MKTPILLSLLMAVAALLTLTACDPAPDNNGNKDGPQQNRTGTVALDRGLGTITVQVMGMTTQAEWNDIANKIVGRLNGKINADVVEWGEQATIDGWTPFFNRGVVYIVETNPVGYTRFKTTGDGKTVYIALDKVDTTDVTDPIDVLLENRTYIADPTPHQSTITAFGKEATVIGDAALYGNAKVPDTQIT